MSKDLAELKNLAKLVRYYILVSTTEAGSGHPTSSLSATELLVTLMFAGFFRGNLEKPNHPNNDRLIFSKGHASPLLYALYAAAGKVSESQILKLRKFGSPLEGHPTISFPYTEAATGSLGQGLSIGAGMALNAKYVDKLPYRTYVLIGDSEMTEGSQWEAIQIAAHYKLDNLVGILDVNRLGQRGETIYGHRTHEYQKRIAAFGWNTITVNGHSIPQIAKAYTKAQKAKGRPTMIIAKTVKGKGVSMLEDKEGWHGKALPRQDLPKALEELGKLDKSLVGRIKKPRDIKPESTKGTRIEQKISYSKKEPFPTRKAYGNALVRIYPKFPDMVVLDAEVSNSTYSQIFQAKYPQRFFEMYVAEQNMVGAALGFARRGKTPFVSTFAAFFTRAFDQVRMSQYSRANIKFCGSHAGVSIGEDGPSQMGLEDLAMFRSLLGSVVLYPSDAVSTEKLVEEAAGQEGIVYIRTTRNPTPILYRANEKFPIGGSKVLKKGNSDVATVIAAGVTVHEALKAHQELKKKGINIRVIDLYSVKPVDVTTLKQAARQTRAIITVEDHFAEGGIGEAVTSALAEINEPIHILAVRKIPTSGKPSELLDYEEISADAIIKKVYEAAKS